MAWEHIEVRNAGRCHLQDLSNVALTIRARYRFESISTGKQRVYWGHQLVIVLPETDIVGRIKAGTGSGIDELHLCNAQLRDRGLRLLVAGNAPSFSVSAMSESSGFGYIGGHEEALHIMHPWPVCVDPDCPDSDSDSDSDSDTQTFF